MYLYPGPQVCNAGGVPVFLDLHFLYAQFVYCLKHYSKIMEHFNINLAFGKKSSQEGKVGDGNCVLVSVVHCFHVSLYGLQGGL